LPGNDCETNEKMLLLRSSLRQWTGWKAKFSERSASMAAHKTRHSVFYVVRVDLDLELSQPRVEVGSNTSTVTLRVVEGDEKGSIESETVKYGRESQGTRNRE
jgi:hypothetical protein